MAEEGRVHDQDVADIMPTSISPGTSGSATSAEDENVNPKFEYCVVNAVAGNQIIVQHITCDEGEASPSSRDINYGKIIQICNDNTKKLLAVDILDDFRHEELQQPDFEVYPQMRQVDVNEYYKGRYGHNKLTQEVGFLRKDAMEAKDIGIEDVVASMWQKKKSGSSETVGITAIVASAGSGKSTLTRRIARRALCASRKMEHAEDLPRYAKTMVHYIELKDVEEYRDITPSKFLFGWMFQYEFQEEQAFEWLDEHQCEAVLIFDGLDQARWDFEGRNPRKIKKHEKASCWTVMYNILSRNILRHVNVYIASREFMISELPAMARPETIITLNGLTYEDAHRLFAYLLKEEGEDHWQKIETMSPGLINLVSIPVFLILAAVVMGRDPTNPPPTTVTELYNRLILCLQSVENIRNGEQILSIVNKLKALAFRGIKEGKVVFKQTDLEEFGVSAKEVQDLMTKVPGNNLLSRHLMPGDFTFFFCLQGVQEYLAAIFITEMDINEFYRFDEEHLHKERWPVVRQILAGVLFSKSQNDIYRVSDQSEKQQVIARSIISQLMKDVGGQDRVELYAAIYESDDDNLLKELDVIDASLVPLRRDEAHVVGSLSARNKSLEYLDLSSCSIDDELLAIIARCTGERIHVKDVDLCDNKFSAIALRSLLGHRRIESLYGNLDWEVVTLSVGGWEVELKNKEDIIKISGSEIEGHFNIKDCTLSLNGIDTVAAVGFLGILFDAIKYNEQRQLLVNQDDLRIISACKLEKISRILLDYTQEDIIDWSLIETFWEKYQVDTMSIAVNGQIPVDDYNIILEHGRAISVFVNIHAMFYVAIEEEFRKTIEACQQNKIEYIRCIFDDGYRASIDDISCLSNNFCLTKATLIYYSERDMLNGDELKKAQKTANDLDTELEVLELFRTKDAWQELDLEFLRRQQRRGISNV